MSAVLTVSLNGSGLDIPPDKAVEIGDHCWYYILSEEDKTAVFAGIDTTWEPWMDMKAEEFTVPGYVRFPDNGEEEYKVVEIGENAFTIFSSRNPIAWSFQLDYGIGCDFCMPYSVKVPETVTKIGESAFTGSNSTGFSEFHFPSSVTEIGPYCFYRSFGIEHLYLPPALKKIPEGFAGMCRYLKECAIPQEVEEIGERAFFRCNSLESVYIPASVKEIGEDAFTALLSIENFEVDTDNEYYSAPDGILLDKEGKTLIAWPFKRTEVIVPEGVETLLGRPLSHAFELFETIDLPSSIKQLPNYSFESDNGIKKLTVRAEVPPVCEVDEQISIFAPEVYVNATLYVPAGSEEAYRTAPVWKEFRNILAIGSDAVETVEMDSVSAEAEYFTLDGRKTESPAEGEIVIRRQNGKSTAIIR